MNRQQIGIRLKCILDHVAEIKTELSYMMQHTKSSWFQQKMSDADDSLDSAKYRFQHFYDRLEREFEEDGSER